jgi:hypothetical protein
MPDEEESPPPYEFLAPVADVARFLMPLRFPVVDLEVGVAESETGSLLFGVGIELSQAGGFAVSAEPLGMPQAAEPIPAMPREETAAAAPQVQINTVIAEVSRAGTRQLKLDRRAEGKPSHWVIEVADQPRQKALLAGLDGLREKGQSKVLAEPRLITLSGQSAQLLIGGERAVTLDGRVQFEEFGTRLTCVPRIRDDGSIRLEVEPEISELCEAAGVSTAGAIVPGRSTQRVHTTADVPPGHTLVISGPKAGGDSFLLVFVTPTVIEPPAGAAAETVHDLLLKCQRELSRGHDAAAEDLAQQALARDRKQVEADPLVYKFNLLRQVKERAALPLGTADPCATKAEGRRAVPQGEPKAVGSRERVVEALLQEFNTAYKEGRYRDAVALAGQALELDPNDARAVAALMIARVHSRPEPKAEPVAEPAAAALARFQGDYKAGRYEEAKLDALQALALAPGYPPAVSALQLACEALARLPRPEAPAQCPYVGTGLRPALPPVDPAVVGALRKILLDGDKGGAEEAEPRDAPRPAPR